MSVTAPTPLGLGAGARPARVATRLAFFVAGFANSAWAPLVPFAKRHAGIDDASLGLLLLCLGLGSIVSMPLAGAASARFGCRTMIVGSGLVAALMLPLLATLGVPWALALALALFGAGIGGIDVAMNIQAIVVERAAGVPLMSGFHGLFSVGGIAGAGGTALLLWLGLPPLPAACCVLAASAVLLLLAAPASLPTGRAGQGGGASFAIPRGIVLLIGAMAFVCFLAEGAALDWSAVFLSTVIGTALSLGGAGYAAFATAMTMGRLTGDRFVAAVGHRRAVLLGGVVAAAGFCVVAWAASTVAALLGFVLVGAGCANIVPVLFSATGRQTAMAESVAVPAVTTLGYAGILVGPAAIGFLAHAATLRVAFLVLAALLLVVGAARRRLPA
ncbi:MFS transporter [Rhizosaccharibacter radicis]|uniref:MFS transporter n=1 Tax=Rhizosaccharibacter radicis TaxID=2782605 RepID=A0ABT1VYJ4_9PROT|nr:MFS transporter [Acetobacteraceae bacterium KSS12]